MGRYMISNISEEMGSELEEKYGIDDDEDDAENLLTSMRKTWEQYFMDINECSTIN